MSDKYSIVEDTQCRNYTGEIVNQHRSALTDVHEPLLLLQVCLCLSAPRRECTCEFERCCRSVHSNLVSRCMLEFVVCCFVSFVHQSERSFVYTCNIYNTVIGSLELIPDSVCSVPPGGPRLRRPRPPCSRV